MAESYADMAIFLAIAMIEEAKAATLAAIAARLNAKIARGTVEK